MVNNGKINLTDLVNWYRKIYHYIEKLINEVIIIRYERFEKLEESKKQSIINAGFTVFGEHGYSKASMEEIVSTANISKGSIFYYFVSKKNFYLYLYEYCGKLIEKSVDVPGTDGMPEYMAYTDFFERLNAMELLKMNFSKNYPNMNKFMKKIVFDTSPEIQGELTKINERYTKERAMAFFKGLDYHKFKDGIDPAMIVTLLAWCAEGCLNQVLLQERMISPSTNNVPDFEKVMQMYHRYVQLFRNNFYKEEYLIPKD